MNALRLNQAVAIERGPLVPPSEVDGHGLGGAKVAVGERFLGGRRILGMGPSDHRWNPQEERSGEERDGGQRANKARPAEWLKGAYRPRNLTEIGALATEELRPGGPGLITVGQDDWRDLEDRKAYLSRRYVGLDLLRKGLVVEVLGTYWNREDKRPKEKVQAEVMARLSGGEPHTTREDLMCWAACFRRMSLEHLYSLDPQGAKENLIRAMEMVEQGVFEAREVQIGEGHLTTLGMTRRGWKEFRKEFPEAEERGLGPREPLGRNLELHEQAVGDALGYFAHEIQAKGGEVVGVWLDRSLRRMHLGDDKVRDLRIEFVNRLGLRTLAEVEVVGVSNAYRMARAVAKSGGFGRRGFDVTGRLKGGSHVAVSR